MYTFCYNKQFSVPGGKYRTDFRYFRYLIVDIRYFSVLWIPTSVSVSVFQNIGYRFAISVYRPKTIICWQVSRASDTALISRHLLNCYNSDVQTAQLRKNPIFSTCLFWSLKVTYTIFVLIRKSNLNRWKWWIFTYLFTSEYTSKQI